MADVLEVSSTIVRSLFDKPAEHGHIVEGETPGCDVIAVVSITISDASLFRQ